MPKPSTIEEFLDLVQKSGVVEEKRLGPYLERLRASNAIPPAPAPLAALMIRDGLLTHFQTEQLLEGKWKRFSIGKYKVLEKLGSGGMGSVYLCEHKLMKRLVAVKVLPTTKAADPAALQRFHREARAVAALDHPNIVRAYDVDEDNNLHFLVMEHVDGASLQEIVKKSGPMPVVRACHYIRQAALGLEHAYQAKLVHRDIKPGNVLVDRSGIVKILDMGLARFFMDEEDDITKKYEEAVLGTADYLAPEQVLDSHEVTIRADIYSLGATFYFCLTGKSPFADASVAQKLIWHRTRKPKDLRSFRSDIPEGVVQILDKMMAKDPAQRYQTPLELVEALAPWTQTPIPPPPEQEMRQLSLAATRALPGETTSLAMQTGSMSDSGGVPKTWQINTPTSFASAQTAPVAERLAPPSPGLAPTSVATVARALSALPSPASTVPLRSTAPAVPPVPALPAVPPAVAPALPSVPEAEAEEEVAWSAITPETDNPISHIPTLPATRSDRSGKKGRRTRPGAASRSGLFWPLVIVSLLVVVGGGAALAMFLLRSPTTDTPGVPPSRDPLIVNSSGENGAYQTLQQAIDKCVNYDRIMVQSSIAESVHLRNKHRVVIEGSPGILWKPPAAGFPPGTTTSKLLEIGNCTDCSIKNFVLDGDSAGVMVGVNTWGECPGVVLDNLQIHNYTLAGVYITNTVGKSDNPLTLQQLHFVPRPAAPEQQPSSGILFAVLPKLSVRKNQHITIRDCVPPPGMPTWVVNSAGSPMPENVTPETIKINQR